MKAGGGEVASSWESSHGNSEGNNAVRKELRGLLEASDRERESRTEGGSTASDLGLGEF